VKTDKELMKMMMNIWTDYAIQIQMLMLLAASEKPIAESELSKQMMLSPKSFHGALSELEKDGFICETETDSNGGECLLLKNPDEISLRNMFETNGGIEFSKQSSGSEQCKQPEQTENQRVKRIHEKLNESVACVFDKVTLTSLMNQMQR
jgi:DNA-binding IscR family transcriptional regulator